MKTKEKSMGEILFEQYLRNLSLQWDYEPEIGGKRPDYLVHSRIDFLCEVEDLTGSDFEKGVLKQIENGKSPGGPYEAPVSYINNAIRRAAKQLRPAKGKYPCVAVIHNDALMQNDNELFVMQAMFGQQKLSQWVGPEGALSEMKASFSPKGRYLTPAANTTLSAIAILEQSQPNIHILHEAEREVIADARATTKGAAQHRSEGSTRRDEAIQVIKGIRELHRNLENEQKLAQLTAMVPRLRIYHNPWAAVRLPVDLLNSEFDENLLYDVSRKEFRRI